MASNNDSDNVLSNLTKAPYINSLPRNNTLHEVFIDDYIDEPSKYRQLISLLLNAPPGDEVFIYLNSGGGNLDTAAAIINGIAITQAEVSAFIMGSCHSAASIIAMYCHQVHVFDSAYMMVHTASFASAGNTPTIKAHTDFTIKQVQKILEDAYEGFLDAKELESVKNGIEIWLDAEQIKKRLGNRGKALAKKAKAHELFAKEEEVAVNPDVAPEKKPKPRKKKVVQISE
jgi:ATP-dependent protease ClpP protease subunit